MTSRLKEKYDNEVVQALMEKFQYSSVMEAVSYTHLTLPTN